MTLQYSNEYLQELYKELGYDDIMPYYEFIDRVKSGQLAIDDERLDNND